MRNGDRVQAATTAARTGQVFGYVLIALGVFEFLAAGLIGLWFIFLGWFLLTAAGGEESAAVMQGSLADVHVGDVMTPNPITFASTMAVADLLDNELHRYRFSSFPLVDPTGGLQGLTTLNRIRHVPVSARQTTRLGEIACPLAQVPRGSPEEPSRRPSPAHARSTRQQGPRAGRHRATGGRGVAERHRPVRPALHAEGSRALVPEALRGYGAPSVLIQLVLGVARARRAAPPLIDGKAPHPVSVSTGSPHAPIPRPSHD